jgi:hypothetical protein
MSYTIYIPERIPNTRTSLIFLLIMVAIVLVCLMSKKPARKRPE